ncbi:NADP(H)-dependent aldo-keto reductase [Pseudomaricurvus sp. HS19]|uniref:NADP(H)-dependent aldo-keto reductase n=1 Tax=Pseudomaricurvus sp. HS19 TaxID=2692626 RepID=UPI001370FC59|nr:NADP(H)-dependent aldo-keto reductase [Pseudomaricurvus sp. HS19]MYM65048.1 NADP(H)-dependent aldo-keto reductase [Pseudomaricurvus sp. HS19]
MQYRPLGNSGLQVSEICLGTMTWGQQNSEAEAFEQLDCALDHGVNFIDTAEMYPVPPRAETQGRTEAYIGNWLASRGCRDKVVLATKVTGRGDNNAGMDHVRDGPRLSKAHIFQAIEDSLVRLRTDYVDLYQVHWPERDANYFGKLDYVHGSDDGIDIHETLETLSQLVSDGKVRHIGLSNETPWGVMRYRQLAEQHGLASVVSIQNPYNLLNRTFEAGLAEMAIREQVPLLAYSPLAFGVLSGKYLNGGKPAGARLTLFERFVRYKGERTEAAAAAYVALAREWGLDPAAMALAFVTAQPFVASNIIGATTMEQLRANLASVELSLPEELFAAINRIHLQNPNPAP